jgi:hypothetical protein
MARFWRRMIWSSSVGSRHSTVDYVWIILIPSVGNCSGNHFGLMSDPTDHTDAYVSRPQNVKCDESTRILTISCCRLY